MGAAPTFTAYLQRQRMARTRVLVADSDLDTLSKVYLALLHRNYKAEACNRYDELPARIRRMKPAVLIMDLPAYQLYGEKMKTPQIILLEKQAAPFIATDGATLVLFKPFSMEQLMRHVQQLVV
jgi:DNA-binding response OmpR family regulator